jgi:hypothetical protein
MYKTLEDALDQILRDRPGLSVHECALAVIDLNHQGLLAEGIVPAPDEAVLQIVKQRVASYLRDPRITVKGISVRRFAAALEDSEHRWYRVADLVTGATSDEITRSVRAHSWSVIREAVGMIEEHSRILKLVCGDAAEEVDDRVLRMVEDALRVAEAEPAAVTT